MVDVYKVAYDRYGQRFIDSVQSLADELGIPMVWILAAMYGESGIRHDLKVTNPLVAGGLIMFIQSTAKAFGTTVDALTRMSAVQQMQYVRKVYIPYKGKIKTPGDLALAAFFPIAVGKPNSFVLEAKNLPAEVVKRANPVFDLNNDNKITKGEYLTWLRKNWLTKFGIDIDALSGSTGTGGGSSTGSNRKNFLLYGGILLVVVIGTAGFLAWKYKLIT